MENIATVLVNRAEKVHIIFYFTTKNFLFRRIMRNRLFSQSAFTKTVEDN